MAVVPEPEPIALAAAPSAVPAEPVVARRVPTLDAEAIAAARTRMLAERRQRQARAEPSRVESAPLPASGDRDEPEPASGVELAAGPDEPAIEALPPEREPVSTPPAEPAPAHPLAEPVVVEAIASRRSPGPQPRSVHAPPQRPATPATSGVPNLFDLPIERRLDIPQVGISMHVYSDTAAERLARINGRLSREGDALDGALRLREVTPDGVILEFGDRAFSLRLDQRWLPPH